MIVICEECGKKYKIDPDKIKGKGARFKCKNCNHVITVSKPQDKPQEPPTPPQMEESVARQEEKRPPKPEPEKEEGPTGKKAGKRSGRKMKRFGLRAKMIVLFLMVPIVFMVAAAALYVLQLEELSAFITHESSKLVTQMAEDSIAGTSRVVFFILGGTIILIGVIVSLYGYGLTRKIIHLTETADRISVGELETEIGIKSNDEIGDLADAIARMQESIRLSMERLRRRR